MTDYDELKEVALDKACDARNVLTLLNRPDFLKMFESCEQEEKERINRFVNISAHEPLRAWYKAKLSKDLGDKSIRQLREIAAELAIENYCKMNKALLLSEIVARQACASKSKD